MKTEFAEAFSIKETIKGFFLLFLFVLFCFIPGSMIEQITSSEFVLDNKMFLGYCFLFVIAISMYFNSIKESIVHFVKDKAKEKNIVFAFVMFFCIIVSMVVSAIILEKSGVINSNEQTLEGVAEQSKSLLYIISAVFLGPVVEESIYRFFVFRSLYQRNFIMAHLVTALLFGFTHFASDFFKTFDFYLLINIIPYVFLSLGLSVTYNKTKCLIYPIIMHMAVNGMATFG